VFAATFCHRVGSYFFCGSLRGTAGLRQRTGFGWQAKPIFEQTGASPAASREQLTHSSVHRLQFGGPLCTETSSGAARGGILRSAANAAPAASKAADAIPIVKSEKLRMSSSRKESERQGGRTVSGYSLFAEKAGRGTCRFGEYSQQRICTGYDGAVQLLRKARGALGHALKCDSRLGVSAFVDHQSPWSGISFEPAECG
jgi:hypothetical protein